MIYPAIGIPALGTNLFCRYAQQKYSHCLRQAGAVAHLFTPRASEEAVAQALSCCDGFLFPDGPDIQPELYGQTSQVGTGKPDQVRDAFELRLLKGALEAGKPIFCICRGMHLLNVAFGGTLYQNIKVRQQYEHFDFWHRATATHPVELDSDSLLAKWSSSDILTVNSIHRQAVDTLGEGLWIAADSPDGFPEALEMEDYPFCLAVQWNPEYMTRRTPVQRLLFQKFAEACRK